MDRPAPSLAAACAVTASCLAALGPAGGLQGILVAVACCFALPAVAVLGVLRPVEARWRWPGWLAAVAAAHALVTLSGGADSALRGLDLVVLAGAAVVLSARSAGMLTLAALGMLAVRALQTQPSDAGAWTGWIVARHGLAALLVTGVVSFLADRLRRRAASSDGHAPLAPRDRDARASGEKGASKGSSESGFAPPRAGTAQRVSELDGLLELARRALGAQTCVLYERRIEPPVWCVAAAASVARDFDGLATTPLGHGLVAWAAKHEVPFRISEPGPQLRAIPHYAGDTEVASFLAVPLEQGPAGRPEAEQGAWAVLACDSPLRRSFGAEAEDLLQAHASELSERIRLRAEMSRLEGEGRATEGLAEASERIGTSTGLETVARALLEECRKLGGAPAGAVLVDRRAAPNAGGSDGASGAGGAVLMACVGLQVEAGMVLDERDGSWATWVQRNASAPVRLPAFGPDRGMARIAPGDGLDASWSLAAWSLGSAGEGQPCLGSLALAWPGRGLPGAAILQGAGVLAAVGGACLLREAALSRLQLRRQLDGLTGLPTGSACLARGIELARAVVREGGRLSIVRFDLDGSAELLKHGGPMAWDDAMEALGLALSAALPGNAELHRWSGDELVALLPGAGEEGASVAARRAAAAVRQGRGLTVSAGAATFMPGDSDFAGLFARAGLALSAARSSGPAKLVVAPRPEPQG